MATSAKTAPTDPSAARAAGTRPGRGEGPARARAAAQADRAERDPRRRRGRQRRVHPVPLHRLGRGPGVPVGGGRRRRDAVLHQHGGRALHAGDRPDRDHRVLAAVEAVGAGHRAARRARHRVAGVGDERRHRRDVRVRRRQPDHDRRDRAVRDRDSADRLAGRLPDRREARVPQGRRDPRVHRRRADRRHHQRRLRRRDPDRHQVRRLPERDRAGDPRRRAGRGRRRRRQQPRAEQLDPRQGLRHGPLRPAHHLADHRRGGGGAHRPAVQLPARTRRTWPAGACGGSARTSSSSSRSR